MESTPPEPTAAEMAPPGSRGATDDVEELCALYDRTQTIIASPSLNGLRSIPMNLRTISVSKQIELYSDHVVPFLGELLPPYKEAFNVRQHEAMLGNYISDGSATDLRYAAVGTADAGGLSMQPSP